HCRQPPTSSCHSPPPRRHTQRTRPPTVGRRAHDAVQDHFGSLRQPPLSTTLAIARCGSAASAGALSAPRVSDTSGSRPRAPRAAQAGEEDGGGLRRPHLVAWHQDRPPFPCHGPGRECRSSKATRCVVTLSLKNFLWISCPRRSARLFRLRVV